MANLSALLYAVLPRINWTGFYLAVSTEDQGKYGRIKSDECRGIELVLGPFQGRPACTRIPLGKGVCGAAARDRKVYIVPDVHKFPGHIACDPRSRSEIVIPIISEGKLVGVLDIDSPYQDRFDETDGEGLSRFTAIIQYPLLGVFSPSPDSST
ncbi:MAG TPA: GAF domain-containing protein [Firmicutes bacterium]|nr:GAF domain-containing protein [Bacillota bacterium]HHY97284.1 GAF domain-containing protein [Bacillota bacterium]